MIETSAGGAVGALARQEGAARLLVVDDTEASLEVAARCLMKAGFVVETARDGRAAIDAIAKGRHDLVLLDIMMPGIDGLAVLRAVRERHVRADLPVIMTTARDGSRDMVEAFALGANDYVTKPLDLPVLLARVRTQLALKGAVDQVRRLEAGLAARNAELQAANARMRSDLEAAARVQGSLLPAPDLRVDGYRFAWTFRPSAALGGDGLNVFRLGDGKVGAYVLDVSGHGVAAALLSVTVSRFLSASPDASSLLWRLVNGGEAETPRYELEAPAAVAERLSRRFPFDSVTGQFFTLVYGVVDTGANVLRYTSAGHPNVLYVPARGAARVLEASGFPIGVGAGAYDEYGVALEPGDRVFIHSDGIPEALGADGELFGVGRTLEILDEGRGLALDEALGALSAAVDGWTGAGERTDDQSVLGIERVE